MVFMNEQRPCRVFVNAADLWSGHHTWRSTAALLGKLLGLRRGPISMYGLESSSAAVSTPRSGYNDAARQMNEGEQAKQHRKLD